MGQVIFVTGTDTGAGKTLLTALLLTHLRRLGTHALAMKPFCSGGRNDINILHRAQAGEISKDQINPFYFHEPVAPLVAARKEGRTVTRRDVIKTIVKLADQCGVLLVEGSGGLLVPLGEGYTLADMIESLGAPVLLAARNKLGAINHTLLTLQALRNLSARRGAVVLMNSHQSNLATATNLKFIKELARPVPVFHIPFLGANAAGIRLIEASEKKVKKTLAGILGLDILSSASSSVASIDRTVRKKTCGNREVEYSADVSSGCTKQKKICLTRH